jgi:dCTP deaminase
MIYPDWKLEEWAAGGGLRPFAPDLVNPGSVDLRWSGRYRQAQKVAALHVASANGWKGNYGEEEQCADALILMPGELYLLDTLETLVIPDDACGDVKLKSSLARVGLEHLHAGWGDPGFFGTLTLEVVNVAPWPIEIVAGDPIVQLVLMALLAPPRRTYRETGRYNGQAGPQPARSHKQPQAGGAPGSQAECVLAYVISALEHHHMSRAGIPTLVKNAHAMLHGREVRR